MESLWQGERITDDEVVRRLDQLPGVAWEALTGEPDIEAVLSSAQRLADASKPDVAGLDIGLTRVVLEHRLRYELGSVRPFRLTRRRARTLTFEARSPLGLLVHMVAPPAVAVLSTVDGLLTGNLNVIGGEPMLSVARLLAEFDESGYVAAHLIAFRDGPDLAAWMRHACSMADGIACWDAEDVFSFAPPRCRVVYLKPKPCIAYLTRDAFLDTDTCVSQLTRLAAERHLEAIYLEGDDSSDPGRLAGHFKGLRAAAARPRIENLPKTGLGQIVWSMRHLIGTVVISGKRDEVAELSMLALASGAHEVVSLADPALTATWPGPHVGSSLLEWYSRSALVHADARFAQDSCLNDLVLPRPDARSSDLHNPSEVGLSTKDPAPVVTKAEAQRLMMQLRPEYAQLYFHSGGSTGLPAVSAYTYDDYDDNTTATAEGLLAAGLDPCEDRVANLFLSGHMYGGFVSFFGVLERLTVTQLPIGEGGDASLIADVIVEHRVNTLLGMTSFLWRFCRAEEGSLRSYGGIRKIFYAGEHMSAGQRLWLRDELGVELVRSAAYTTSDIGPIGYQCGYSAPNVYHLHDELHDMEVLELDVDRQATSGRLIFTRKTRIGLNLDRYEIGDTGRLIQGACDCGRLTPRFELLGRHSDLIRVAGRFIDYRRLVATAAETAGYASEVQVVIGRDDAERERLIMRVDRHAVQNAATMREAILSRYDTLRDAAAQSGLDFIVEVVDTESLARAPISGKLRTIIDNRLMS